jgi:acetoin:2,6-dichlorophenolindophenol oxidoreductase subunit alpha
VILSGGSNEEEDSMAKVQERRTAPSERVDQPLIAMYRRMVRIRQFELMCQRLWVNRIGPGPKGEVTSPEHMPGFVHLSIGQEAVTVGVCAVLLNEDNVAGTHRGHGLMIAKGADVNRMMAELYGRTTGYCRGKGGSMHFFAPEIGVLGTNGIVAGGIGHAVGAAMAHKLLGRDNVAAAFFGDGASNQGVFFEAMNLASIWHLPVIFVCENNQWSEWTEYERLTAGAQIHERAAPFGIPSMQVDGNDVLAVRDAASQAVKRARAGRGPSLIEAKTYTQCPHMEGEEVFAGKYRSDEEIMSWTVRDPILQFGDRLIVGRGATQATLDGIDAEERQRVEDALEFAVESSAPDLSELTVDVFSRER